jgi:hypothetical protein
MTQDKLSEERLTDLATEYGEMAASLTGELQDGPGTASTFYMSASLGEVASMARELLALRHAVQAYVDAADELSEFERNYPNDSTSRWESLLFASDTAKDELRRLREQMP